MPGHDFIPVKATGSTLSTGRRPKTTITAEEGWRHVSHWQDRPLKLGKTNLTVFNFAEMSKSERALITSCQLGALGTHAPDFLERFLPFGVLHQGTAPDLSMTNDGVLLLDLWDLEAGQPAVVLVHEPASSHGKRLADCPSALDLVPRKTSKAMASPRPSRIDKELFDAVIEGDIGTVRRLIGQGASLGYSTRDGVTALHTACEDPEAGAIVGLLIDKGADVNAKDKGGDTPLHYAVAGENVVAVKRLLAAGAKPSVQNKRGRSVVDAARVEGQTDILELLRSRA
jgi:hypothetical protein